MKIPYSMSNFADIRRGGYFYADKTPFLPLLESGESGYRTLMFLRPRRMGKSVLASMLEHYYDMARADQFDELFGGLWVHEHPTPEHNQYLVLSLDFSTVNTAGGRESIERTFVATVKGRIVNLLLRYRDRIPMLGWLFDRVDDYPDAESLLGMLADILSSERHKLYVIIDEYDNFINKLLSDGAHDLYEALVERTGFVRSFYSTLKAGTSSGAVARVFITGITPILLDDLSSGFNIIRLVSQHPRFASLVGFTRADVERAVDGLLGSRPDLADLPGIGDRAALLDLLERYYDGYRFDRGARERIFNSDMVLYFLSELENRGEYPMEMLDRNVRTDYGRLQRIGSLTGGAAAERRAIYETILTEGHIWGTLIEQFGVRGPSSSRDQFVSFLYYLGMVTLSPVPPSGKEHRFEIPNRVIRELQWEHLAVQLKDQAGIELDTHPMKVALRRMAIEGTIDPFKDLFRDEVVKAMGVKDQRQFSEKALKLMLMTCLVLTAIFHPLSEEELAQGYCDLFLVPAIRDARYAWMLECKYRKTGATPAAIEKAFAEAEEQLERYSSDERLLPLLTQGRELRSGTLVFVGSKKVLFRPWPTPPEAKKARAAKARSAPSRGRA